jgi:uncharacterized membrane protein YdjX (TVP38/TMEM64 family)
VLAALVLGGWVLWRLPAAQAIATREHIAALRETLALAWWGPPAFVGTYALLSTFDFSGLALSTAGGVIFGFERGVVLNTIGANLGANAAYWTARLLGRDAVGTLLGHRATALHRSAERGGFLWLLRLRLIPVVPFNLLDVTAGVSGMPWAPYAAATALGMVPGTILFTYSAAEVFSGGPTAGRSPSTRLFVVGALLLLLTFAPALARRLRRRAGNR